MNDNVKHQSQKKQIEQTSTLTGNRIPAESRGEAPSSGNPQSPVSRPLRRNQGFEDPGLVQDDDDEGRSITSDTPSSTVIETPAETPPGSPQGWNDDSETVYGEGPPQSPSPWSISALDDRQTPVATPVARHSNPNPETNGEPDFMELQPR